MNKLYLLLFTLGLTVFSLNCYSQSAYPIHVQPMLTPPYSLTLSDYAKPASQQLVVTIQVRDVTVTNLPVRLHLKIETTTGASIETLPNIITTPLYLTGGEMSILFGDDLKDYFNIDNLHFQG
ncbi:MAG: hypothetical protein LBG15_15800, partial [Dysgonamonadaceae bacterium]|nr:hypothetical protein [Dysgonamonadaceae bacterium]